MTTLRLRTEALLRIGGRKLGAITDLVRREKPSFPIEFRALEIEGGLCFLGRRDFLMRKAGRLGVGFGCGRRLFRFRCS